MDTASIEFISIVLLLTPIYVTVFWAIILHTKFKTAPKSKLFLGKFMIVATIMYMLYLIYYYPLYTYFYYYVDNILILCLLLLFPMYYIYIRLLTIEQKFNMKKHGRYFVIPIVVFVLYSIGILYMTPEEHYIFSHSHDAKISNTNGIMLYQSIALLIFKIVFLVQSIIYVVLSTILANKHKAYVQNFYADNDHDFSKQYSYISLLLSLTIVIYIFLSIMDKDSFFVTGPFITYVSPILVSVLYFILGLFGSQQKSLLINEKHECVELYSDTCQTIEEDSHIHLDQIKTKILKLFEEDKIYLDCELNLWEVSRLVGTNRTYVSSVINNYFNQNFSSFVNKYRVKHTEELISENPKLTNEDLAALSGFGSVTSMHRAFLNIKGKSVKQIKKQV